MSKEWLLFIQGEKSDFHPRSKREKNYAKQTTVWRKRVYEIIHSWTADRCRVKKWSFALDYSIYVKRGIFAGNGNDFEKQVKLRPNWGTCVHINYMW